MSGYCETKSETACVFLDTCDSLTVITLYFSGTSVE